MKVSWVKRVNKQGAQNNSIPIRSISDPLYTHNVWIGCTNNVIGKDVPIFNSDIVKRIYTTFEHTVGRTDSNNMGEWTPSGPR